MNNREWQQVVKSLVQAKRRLADAWQVLDGTDGAAPGVEDAFKAALAGIDRIYALEQASEYNADVASPSKVQEFWDAHESLPGFALGT